MKTIKLVLKRILDFISFVAKMIAATMLAVMLVVSLVEIVRRYIMGQSFPWAGELIQYCIVGVAMFGGAAAFREAQGLVAFDLVTSRVRGTPGFVIALLINTISMAFAGYMFRNAVLTLKMPSIYKQISIGLKVSMFWPYLPIAVGLGMIVLFAVEKYFTLTDDFRNGKYGKSKEKLAPKEGSDNA